MANLYWNVYRGLERELLELADVIHIDDRQLEVYSVKIAELLLRTSVEIEAISKELYFREGGTKMQEGSDLYFDTDCLALLESKWLLSKKVVIVSSPSLYLTNEDNLTLTPLSKASKRGTSGSDWKKAYQAVKHDRDRSLHKGNLKHFIRALAALFVLNIYYKSDTFDLRNDRDGQSFDSSMNSKIFSVSIHPFPGVSPDGRYLKGDDFDQHIYLIQATKDTNEAARKIVEEYFNDILAKSVELAREEIRPLLPIMSQDEVSQTLIELIEKNKSLAEQKVSREIITQLSQSFNALRFEAVLNESQY